MMNSSLQDTKIDLIQWLTVLHDQETLQKIMDIRDEMVRFATTTPTQKASIQKGLDDADAGKLHAHSVAKQVYEKWL